MLLRYISSNLFPFHDERINKINSFSIYCMWGAFIVISCAIKHPHLITYNTVFALCLAPTYIFIYDMNRVVGGIQGLCFMHFIFTTMDVEQFSALLLVACKIIFIEIFAALKWKREVNLKNHKIKKEWERWGCHVIICICMWRAFSCHNSWDIELLDITSHTSKHL